MFDMSTAILHITFKTTTPLIDATVNETLLLGDYRSLQLFHCVKFSSVIDSLLNGTTNSTRSRDVARIADRTAKNCRGHVT